MRVLLVHNYYRQRGGEDLSFEDEAGLLEEHGHEVIRYTRSNDELDAARPLLTTWQAIWNRQCYREVRSLIRRHRPELMHCTNTFPLISPAVYYAAYEARIPIVQALRNYRLLCLNSFLSREGGVCELCVGRTPLPGVRHACYRQSRAASAAVAAMLWFHRRLGTYTRLVTVFYTLSEFARSKFIEAGFPGERILVKANCVSPDPGPGQGDGEYAIFVGRLSPEKGIDTLLEAWPHVRAELPLHVVGDGPLAEHIERAALRDPRIHYVGPLARQATLDAIGSARLLVMPSIWYETFGRTIIEAYAKGVPVIASRLGAMAELVEDRATGRLFAPGDSVSLAAAVNDVTSDPRQWLAMREAAREAFLRRYTPAANYARLMEIYDVALGRPTLPAEDANTACSPCMLTE